MIDYQQRLTRLRELADVHTTQSYGRGDIEELLKQPAGDPEAIECPQYVAIVEHADERNLFCDDSISELLATFTELASGDIRERPEAIIDLDTGVRHEAHNTHLIAFAPPHPGACEHVARLHGGERSALRLLCEVAEEHTDGNTELTEAITIADALLTRTDPPARDTGGEEQ